MTDNIHEKFFASREAASVAAAERIVDLLGVRLQSAEAASLVVTGGSSPLRCYAELAASNVDWSAVHVTLSDERWVPPTDSNSNEKLVREGLLTGRAKDAQLLPVYSECCTPTERCRQLNDALSALPMPFACALLGMGADGHFASLFPDAENLDAGLDIENPDWCIPVETAASEHVRVSMTLAALLRSQEVALLFFGDAKRDIYEQAKTSTADVPVAKLLSQTNVPVHVFWAA
jgi:6-phosphogluconolactonase